MSNVITKADLTNAFTNLVNAALDAGVSEASRWHFETGSKYYGNAFRIWLAHEDYAAGMEYRRATGEQPETWHTGHYSPVVNDFLGMTKREAFDSMRAMTSAFRAVSWARKGL